MANEKESRGSGSVNPNSPRKQPIGSKPISREREERVQLDVDADQEGASVQTVTAQDESGQE